MTRDVDTDELAADLQREANGRVDTPAEYHPPLETVVNGGYYGILVREEGTETRDGQFIHCEHPVEARQ